MKKDIVYYMWLLILLKKEVDFHSANVMYTYLHSVHRWILERERDRSKTLPGIEFHDAEELQLNKND